MEEKINDFIDEHPSAFVALCSLAGLVVSIPLAIGAYKLMGHQAGKAAAKELIKLGIAK